MATSVADFVRRNAAKRGLAIVVTNDYSSLPDDELKTLNGPRKDGERMQRVFTELGIATLWKQNIGYAELVHVLRQVASLPGCPSSYKSISFVFSGHGHGAEEVFMQDGKLMGVQEIVNFLLPRQAPNIGNVPKLFFIDACRGSENMQPVVCPRGEGGASSKPIREVHLRGATEKETILIPPDGNTLVAYSTTSSHRAHEQADGGVWMKALAEKLRSSKQAIQMVLTEVRSELHSRYQNHGWKEHMQMPETITTLLQPVFFHPTADVKLPDVPKAVPDPGEFTQRNPEHPGHYRGRLQNLEQRGVITNVDDTCRNESTGFICIMTFIHAATARQLHFQSERVMPTKSEAKESAAKIAVLSLDVESTSSSKAIPKPEKVPTPPKTSTKPSTKDPVSKLKEFCDQKKIPQPHYEEEVCDGAQQFRFRVTIQGKMFQGTVQKTKKEAKKVAAQIAINRLELKQ